MGEVEGEISSFFALFFEFSVACPTDKQVVAVSLWMDYFSLLGTLNFVLHTILFDKKRVLETFLLQSRQAILFILSPFELVKILNNRKSQLLKKCTHTGRKPFEIK